MNFQKSSSVLHFNSITSKQKKRDENSSRF